MKVRIIKKDARFYPVRIDYDKEVSLYCPFLETENQCGSWCPLLEIRQGKFTELVLWKCGGSLQVAEVIEKDK